MNYLQLVEKDNEKVEIGWILEVPDNLNRDEILEALKEYKSRPKGEWIDKGFEEYYCSNCSTKAEYCIGQPFGTYEIYQILSDFCPNCGADMRGEE